MKVTGFFRAACTVVVLTCSGLSHAQTYKPLPTSTAKLISFDSENCTGYWTPDYQCKPMKGMAYLFEPKGAWSALVMASHGAQGVDQRVFEYADALTQKGYAALVIDHWSPRNINIRNSNYSLATAQGGTTSSIATDTLWASEYIMANYPQVKKFGLIGESMGAMAAVQLTKQRMTDLFAKKIPTKPFAIPFSAMVGLYPGCSERVQNERFVGVPFLILAGELDDHTLAKDCVDYEGWVNSKGGDLKTQIVHGASHDFDAPHALEFRARGQNISKCLNIVTDSTITIVASGKVLPNTLEGQARLPKECSYYGLKSGHGPDKFVAVPQWLAFFDQHLK
jgi:dienelactone hydrolase